MQNNPLLKNKLADGKTVLGTWCEIPSPEFINVLAKGGLDFVIIDMEHGSCDFEQAGKMVMAAQVEGCSPIIRVPTNNESTILRALELGAEGVIVPHVESAEERKRVIDAIKFPPIGIRSLNPYVRAGGYRSTPDFTTQQNKNTLSAILVESLQGIENIEEIIDDDYLDVVYMGSYDISAALGLPGKTKHPKVVGVLEKMTKIITKSKKVAACLFHSKDDLHFFKKNGVKFLCYKVDTAIVFDEIQRVRKLI